MTAPESQTISIVMPFLNESENLRVLYQRLCAVFVDRPEKVEWVFVDDGSTDDGPQWLEQTLAGDPRVRLLRLSRNFGHQVAITAGLDRAIGDAVIVMDADLQDPPEVIPDLLAKWREGVEVVYAVRRSRAGETWLKKALAAGFYRLFSHLVSVPVPRNAGDFRLLDRQVVLALRGMRETHRYMRAMTSWVGFRQSSVAYDRAARQAGVTKYPVWKSMRLAWDGITSFSGSPLRWMSQFGFITCLVGLVWILMIVIGRITKPQTQVQGWASIQAAILFMGGMQLVCIGFVGQYLSRTFEETKKRPLYFIRSDSLEHDESRSTQGTP